MVSATERGVGCELREIFLDLLDVCLCGGLGLMDKVLIFLHHTHTIPWCLQDGVAIRMLISVLGIRSVD